MAYGWLYMAKHEITSAAEVTLTALVHHLPAKTLSTLPELGFVQQAKGIYYRSAEPVAHVIVFPDLPKEF